jgi:hypothetical protein
MPLVMYPQHALDAANYATSHPADSTAHYPAIPIVLSGAAAAYRASPISVGIGAILYAVIGLATMAAVPGYIPIEQPRPMIEDHADDYLEARARAWRADL